MKIRHQLAAYSPIPTSAGLIAAGQMLHLGGDPRPELREVLKRDYQAREIVLCGSGTQALQLALELALQTIGTDSVVALPAFGCYDIATAAVGAGVRVSLYDIDPNTLAPDSDSLERVLSAGARVIVAAPLYGVPLAWNTLKAVSDRHGALMIEDAAQGHGASWCGKSLGSLGSVSTLSFGRGKGWTGGRGGALLVRGAALNPSASRPQADMPAEALTLLGLVAQWTFGRPAIYGIPRSVPALHLGDTSYRKPVPATSMTRAAAATLLRSRDVALLEAAQRRVTASSLLASIDGARVKRIQIPDDASPGYLRLPVRVNGGMNAFTDQAAALACGVAPSYPATLAVLPAIADRMVGPEVSWPGAETLVRELVTLPSHSRLTDRDLDSIARMFRSIV